METMKEEKNAWEICCVSFRRGRGGEVEELSINEEK